MAVNSTSACRMTRQSRFTRRSLLKSAAATTGLVTGGILGQRASASEPLRIGSVVSLTGPFNASRQQYHFSLQMVQDEINAKGGIAGRKLEIVFADYRDSNAAAVNAYEKASSGLPLQPTDLPSLLTEQIAHFSPLLETTRKRYEGS
jgi:branched-chain amino acid transport system substrate-binding protein